MELNEGKLIYTYAYSLLSVVTDEKLYDSYIRQMDAVSAVFVEHDDLMKFVMNPLVNFEQRFSVVSDIMDKIKVNPDIKQFVRILVDNQRVHLIRKISDKFLELIREKTEVTLAKVYSVCPLDEKTKQAISKKLKKITSQSIELECEIDPSILGGLQIHMNNQIIDYSLKGQLEQLKYTLKQEG